MNKKILIPIFIFILIIIIIAVASLLIGAKKVEPVAQQNEITQQPVSVTQPTQNTDAAKTMTISGRIYNVIYANTEKLRVQGLSYRTSLAQNSIMFFVFDTEDRWGIWMKDMHFPLDILWLDKNYKVVHIVKNALPESYPEVYEPSVPARYVIEANIGFADQNNIKIGDIIKI
jgi:uncharacterized membrane protein (UPF0127 family)